MRTNGRPADKGIKAGVATFALALEAGAELVRTSTRTRSAHLKAAFAWDLDAHGSRGIESQRQSAPGRPNRAAGQGVEDGPPQQAQQVFQAVRTRHRESMFNQQQQRLERILGGSLTAKTDKATCGRLAWGELAIPSYRRLNNFVTLGGSLSIPYSKPS